jgi:hypothetical protein
MKLVKVTQWRVPDSDELGLDDDIIVHNWIDRGDSSTPDTATFRKYRGIATKLGVRTSLVGQTEVDAFSIDVGGGCDGKGPLFVLYPHPYIGVPGSHFRIAG